ncbi:MAG: alpha/beta hydrolase [Acidimicrobiales bacterium]
MPIASANGIDLCYDTIGDPADEPLLLVMGFTAQLTAWDDGFCRLLADGGRYVIRFDNRDCGLSTHLDGVTVDLPAVLKAWEAGEPPPPVPYTLSDFSNDAFGLLDHLGIEPSHIVGASMGGMIVQTMAIEHPERVRSMTSIMSTTGELDYYKWDPDTRAALSTPPPADRAGYVEHSARLGALLAPHRHFDPAKAPEQAAAAYDRAFYPEGAIRQTAAIRGSGHRADGLRRLRVPTLVIHGTADTLILPLGGQRTAELVDGANLLLVKDMGHDLPEPLWPFLTGVTLAHTAHGLS